jgi:hypothetical protein
LAFREWAIGSGPKIIYARGHAGGVRRELDNGIQDVGIGLVSTWWAGNRDAETAGRANAGSKTSNSMIMVPMADVARM